MLWTPSFEMLKVYKRNTLACSARSSMEFLFGFRSLLNGLAVLNRYLLFLSKILQRIGFDRSTIRGNNSLYSFMVTQFVPQLTLTISVFICNSKSGFLPSGVFVRAPDCGSKVAGSNPVFHPLKALVSNSRCFLFLLTNEGFQ